MRSNHLRDCPKNILLNGALFMIKTLPTHIMFYFWHPHANRLPPILQILELLLLLSSLDNEENINPLENTNLLEVYPMFKSKNCWFSMLPSKTLNCWEEYL
jgi:hypothetical protein